MLVIFEFNGRCCSVNLPGRVALALVLAVVVAALGTGCSDDETEGPEAQPAPDVTRFVEGDFGRIPVHPRSEEVSERNEEREVVAQSFSVRGASPRQVLEWYRVHLDPDVWSQAGDVEELGDRSYRGEWVSDDYRLRVSSIDGETLEQEDESQVRVVSQYSLTLRPLD